MNVFREVMTKSKRWELNKIVNLMIRNSALMKKGNFCKQLFNGPTRRDFLAKAEMKY
jgi:hypothetical protein